MSHDAGGHSRLQVATGLLKRAIAYFLSGANFSPPPPGTKDITYSPYFRGALSRAVWRLYALRLTPASRWFILPTLIFMTYGSTSLQIQAYVPFCYAFGLWIVGLLGALFCTPRVALRARHTDRICAGETLQVDVDIEQRGLLRAAPLTVLPHGLPPSLDAENENGADLPILARRETAQIHLGIRCSRRGVFRWKGYRVQTDFPLGMFNAYCLHTDSQQILVFPRFTPLARLRIPVGRTQQPGGVALASRLGESFEYLGNREYREGDSLRNMDWRATARMLRPIIREYREEYFQRVAVVLDTCTPGKRRDRKDTFERAVSLAAAITDNLARQEYLIDIFAAGPNLYHLAAGRSLAYQDQILDILACVESGSEEPFEILEPEIAQHLSKLTTVICVFLDWNEPRRIFAEKMRAQGAGVKVVIVRNAPCTLDPAADASLGYVPVLSCEEIDAGVEEL